MLERKHAAIMRDLKRQALQEKKRAERLEERLRAMSPEFEHVPDMSMMSSSPRGADDSSVGSWGVVGEKKATADAGGPSPATSTTCTSDADTYRITAHMCTGSCATVVVGSKRCTWHTVTCCRYN